MGYNLTLIKIKNRDEIRSILLKNRGEIQDYILNPNIISSEDFRYNILDKVFLKTNDKIWFIERKELNEISDYLLKLILIEKKNDSYKWNSFNKYEQIDIMKCYNWFNKNLPLNQDEGILYYWDC